MNAATDHARYRELLSRRLDERLAAADARELQQHLAGCPRCRVVDREYRRQRQALRGLAPVTPPRDLGARTAAALDREVAGSGASRWRRQPRRRRRRSGFALAGLAALAVVVVLAAAVIGVLRPSVNAPIALQPAQNRPTPFAVPPQELALVGEDPGGLKLYRASVDRVCPPSAANCTSLRPSNSQPLGSSGVSVPSTVVVGPTGDRAAITGRDSTGRQVYAVVQLPPTGSATRRGTAGATGEPAQSASPPPTPGSSPSSTAGAAASTASPSPGASPTPRTAPASASVTGPPAATTSPSPASTGAAASASPGTTGSAAGGTEPPPGGSAGPSPSATAGSPPPTATPTVAATLEATLPPGSALPADARPILRDVLAAGAPPAWSADGQVLAFSAMPADASHGPDIYTWRPGDREALRITDDHSTYFGSWAGSRIVASRTVAGRGSSTALSARDLEAVVIDPASREVRPVRDAAMWLPSVDPTSRWVVYWHGRLERDGATVRPVAGRLVIADWRSLDPFETAPDDAGSPSSPRAVAVASGGAPVEWQLRWSDDGRAYGVWTPDSRGAATGRLVVVAVGDETSDQDTVLLGPTASTRAFTLGEDRVAWVAPGTGGKAGELRVGTWGKSGKGSLRVDVVDGGALPDF